MIRRIASGSLWGILGAGLGRVFNLAAMILAARALGGEGFGQFGLIQSTLGVFGVLVGAGLGVTATRFIARYRQDDPARAGRIMGMVWGVTLITSALAVLGLIVFAGAMSRFVIKGEELRFAFIVGGPMIALSSLRGVQDAVLTGFEQFRDTALLRCLEGAVSLLAVPLMARWFGVGGAVGALALSSFCAVLLGLFFQRAAMIRSNIVTDWSGGRDEWAVLRTFSLPSLLTNIVGMPVIWFGLYSLSLSFGGFHEVGLYNAAYQWHGPLVFIPMVLCSVSMPMLVQFWGAQDLRNYKRLFLGLCLAGIAVSGIPAIAVSLFSDQILRAYGADFLSGSKVLILLAFAAPVHFVANIAASALQSMNRAWLVFGTNVFWSIAFIVMCATAIPADGSAGLAAALIVSYGLLAGLRVLVVIILSQRRMHVA